MKILENFISINRKISNYFTPLDEYESRFDEIVSNHLKFNTICLEIGGSNRPFIQKEFVGLLVGCDPDIKIKETHYYDKFYCGTIRDVEERNFDLIISRYVLEHVRDCKQEYSIQIEKLNVNGKAIHIYPLGFHPFSLLSKFAESSNLKKVFIKILRPEFENVTGYKTYYNLGDSKSLIKYLSSIPNIKYKLHFEFGAVDYFGFFFPLAFCVSLFNVICKKFNLNFFASNVYVEITKISK